MVADQLIVIAAGVAAIVWINWYFFRAGEPGRRAADKHPSVPEPPRHNAET